MKNLKEKTFAFTTYNHLCEEVESYTITSIHVSFAREYAKNIVANSRDNETRHGRVTLAK